MNLERVKKIQNYLCAVFGRKILKKKSLDEIHIRIYNISNAIVV